MSHAGRNLACILAALLLGFGAFAARAGDQPTRQVPAMAEQDTQDSGFLRNFVAVYKVERDGYDVARSTFRLQRLQDGIYRFTSESHAIGILRWFVNDIVRQESLFHLVDGKLIPISYRYTQEHSSKNRNQSIDYDWTQGIARLDYRGKKGEVRLEPGALDIFLMELAIAVDVKDNSLDQQYRIVDHGGIKIFRIASTEESEVKTPAGKYQAISVERVNKDNDKNIRFWLSPKLDYLPVIMEQSKKNEEPIRMSLMSFKRIDLSKDSQSED